MAIPSCHARALTLAEADAIIIILLFVVTVLLVLGGISLHHNRVISRRNEQLLRILNALDDYRAIVGDGSLTLDEQEQMTKKKQQKQKTAKVVPMDESQSFFVKMDARVNKEKPFTNPDFNQQALAEFMGVDVETFCKLVPRYKNADRTLDYINSLRAEYAAKILLDQSDCSMDDMAGKCGFKGAAAFVSAFKFAFGVTPTDYLNSMSQMFKKKGMSQ
ncbi:MAG: helix-turn-helix domain-containing protein [Prevotella sp.]|nr:helix-turn-helix domain-containing protein [Prevotella sp.]